MGRGVGACVIDDSLRSVVLKKKVAVTGNGVGDLFHGGGSPLVVIDRTLIEVGEVGPLHGVPMTIKR